MELLLAVLIAFGVVTSGDAAKLSSDSAKVEALIKESNISQKQIDDHKKIIEMEDTDM